MEISKEKIAALVTEIQNGNNGAFNELYKLTNQRAYYVALEFVKKDEDAQDILQESYVKALSKIGELDKPESFQSWLNQIVANKSKDFLKKKKPMLFEAEENEVFEVLPDEDLSFRPESSLDQNELQRTVMEVLDELNEEKRACVLMMYFEELSVSEIAQTLEIPEGTVKTRLFAARKDLKEKFAKRGITSAYSVAPIGVVLWAMRKSCITAGAAFAASSGSATILTGITATTAASAAVASAATSATAAAAGTATAKAAGGIGAKIAAMSLAKKVVAGIAAAAVIGGTTAGVVTLTKNAENKSDESNAPANNIVESVTENEYADGYYTDGYYTYTLDDNNNATIVDCDPSLSGDVVIPSELDGHKVTAIGCIKNENAEKLSEDAYIYNTKEFVEIYEYFLAHPGAFSKCPEITSITVPESIERIELGAFTGCFNLKRFDVDSSNPNYSSDENGVLFSKDKKTLISYPTASALSAYTVPDSVTEIEPFAFLSCKNIQNLKLSSAMKEMNTLSFVYCKFGTVILPEGIERTNSFSFLYCHYYKLYLPKSLTYVYAESLLSFENVPDPTTGSYSELVADENVQWFYAGNDDEFRSIAFVTTNVHGEEEIIENVSSDGIILNTSAPY